VLALPCAPSSKSEVVAKTDDRIVPVNDPSAKDPFRKIDSVDEEEKTQQT
jgi:hypothetical protein